MKLTEFHIPCRNRGYLLRGEDDDDDEKKTEEDESLGTHFLVDQKKKNIFGDWMRNNFAGFQMYLQKDITQSIGLESRYLNSKSVHTIW